MKNLLSLIFVLLTPFYAAAQSPAAKPSPTPRQPPALKKADDAPAKREQPELSSPAQDEAEEVSNEGIVPVNTALRMACKSSANCCYG